MTPWSPDRSRLWCVFMFFDGTTWDHHIAHLFDSWYVIRSRMKPGETRHHLPMQKVILRPEPVFMLASAY